MAEIGNRAPSFKAENRNVYEYRRTFAGVEDTC